MPRIPARLTSAAAILTLVVAPLVTPLVFAGSAEAASPARAASQSVHRVTFAMSAAEVVGWGVGLFAESDKIDGRSTSSVRAVMQVLKMTGDDVFRVTVSGLSDRNHDGLDDDGKLRVRVLDNVATLTLHRRYTHLSVDSGFVFRNSRSVLKESAQSFDRILRRVAGYGLDTWAMGSRKALQGEMPPGVRVVSDYDGNHDGYDDDGRLTFLANGKAVTLTLGNTSKMVGRVTYGPTWRTKARRRNHHPLVRPSQARSSGTLTPERRSGLRPSLRLSTELRRALRSAGLRPGARP